MNAADRSSASTPSTASRQPRHPPQGKFFGGHAFKKSGKQFAMVMGQTPYFCINDLTRPDFEQRGSQPFAYSTRKGRVQVRKHYAAPSELLDDPEALLLWARRAVDAALHPDLARRSEPWPRAAPKETDHASG